MLKLERIYTKPFDTSGKRIFVDRLWCRGISKANAKLDDWAKVIAPSTELRKWFQHVDARFPEFKAKYEAELDRNAATKPFVKKIRKDLKRGDVILLYGAKNAKHNNAVVLKDYLGRKLGLKLTVDSSFVHFLYNDGETNRSKKLANDVKWLNQHSAVAKFLNLKTRGQDKIYHGTDRKALDHQALMALAIKNN